MNYKLIYDNLINRAQNRARLNGYTETHHIIPRCMGGTNDKCNLVELTAEEHFIAHKLLAKIHPNHYGIIKAVICMGMNSNTHERHVNKSYAWERRKMAELQSGEGNPFYGKHHTEEHKQYMSKLMKSRPITRGNKISKTKRMNPTKWTEEAKRLHSINQSGKNNGMYGRKHSAKSIQKIKDNMPDNSGANNPAAKPIEVNGVKYKCMKDASKATGLSMYKLRILRKTVNL